ncbi:MAG: hypothetical protein AAF490_32230 [Chloroflexota bacterium]
MSRWHDNSNGAVTDMTTNLVWLKNANWGGLQIIWSDSGDHTP